MNGRQWSRSVLDGLVDAKDTDALLTEARALGPRPWADPALEIFPRACCRGRFVALFSIYQRDTVACFWGMAALRFFCLVVTLHVLFAACDMARGRWPCVLKMVRWCVAPVDPSLQRISF